MSHVAIVGGGIGGLTAAHELADRGFDVVVYEANERFGGKARSMPATDGRRPLHGEHGFRFFPAFYRHVVDTMARIPDGEGTVADNLVPTDETLVAETDGPGRLTASQTPETVGGWLDAIEPPFADELPPRDVRFLTERLLYLLSACQRRREEQLDEVSWWSFIDADNRSAAFRERLAYATQSLVALRPQVASARTVGTIYCQLLFGQLDPTRPAERVLDGPTSVAWLDPWVDHLASLGVSLQPETTVAELGFDGERVTGLVLESGERVAAEEVVLAVPVHLAPEFVTAGMARQAPELRRIERLETAWMNGVQYFLAEDVPVVRGHQVYADAPWALTAVSQRQFWTDYDVAGRGPDAVEGVLSVIASDWDTPGIRHEKPARACTREEIVEEIWAQVEAHFGEGDVALSDDLVVDTFLDPAIVETDDGVENRSPLLINTAGSLKFRPPADVGIENLTLAGEYVRTNADLASMESASEAGRRAANAVAERHDVPGTASVWELAEPAVFELLKREDRVRYRLGLPHPAEVTQSLRSVRRRLVEGV